MTYLEKLKTELVMSKYLDGWTIRWIKEKIKELEAKINGNT